MMTLQQAFDRAARHLILQNQRSVDQHSDDEQLCAYRGTGGLKCAVGALIADEHYDPKLESMRAASSEVRYALRDSGWPTDERAVSMYERLQTVHDTVQPCLWETVLMGVAEDYDLDDTIIQTSIHERDLRVQEAADAI